MGRNTDLELDYTHWQILLLRDALEAYRRFTADHETGKRPLSWNALRESVAEYTDVTFGKDDLRQFVEGKKQGEANFRIPQRQRLKAIFRFLTDENIEMLTPEEFEKAELIGVHAPLHLSRYLVSLSVSAPLDFPRSLVGQYESIGATDKMIIQKNIQILFQGPRFASMSETHEVYSKALPPGAFSSRRLRKMIATFGKPDYRIRHNGWAIVTPEDNILAFMKDTDNHDNHYWKLAVEHPIWEDGFVDDLLLTKFDWPLFLDGETSTGDAMRLSAQKAMTETWHFTRRGVVENAD